MDEKKITSTFSRGVGQSFLPHLQHAWQGLAVLAVVGLVGQVGQAPALAQVNGTVSYGANGPVTNLSMPTAQVSNVAQDAASGYTGPDSNGATGTIGRSSYATGEAPEDAGMSGLTSNQTSQNLPINGPGSNFGPNMTGAVNGLMAPGSVNQAGIPLWDGAGYGFNANPQNQVYSMATGVNKLINNVVNSAAGGLFTIGGPALPVTSTGSVNINMTTQGGRGVDGH